MKISDKINSNTIVLQLKSNCIHDVLQELLDHCIKLDYLTSSVKLISSLDEKEKIISSASGRGVAYHYNTSIEVDDVITILGIAPSGIDYEAPDGMLCNFILLILEPASKPDQHRQLINYFQDMIGDMNFKEQLLDAKTIYEVEDVIKTWDNQLFMDNELE